MGKSKSKRISKPNPKSTQKTGKKLRGSDGAWRGGEKGGI